VSLAADPRVPMVSANVGLFGLAAGITPTYRIVKAGGKKIGVTSIVGTEYQAKVKNAEVEFARPEEALKDVVPRLKAEADILVLLAHSTPGEAIELVKKFPEFHIVATAGGTDEPPAQPRAIPGSQTILMEVGKKGMFVTVLAFVDDPKQPWRYQRVPLDRRFQVTPEMKQVMSEYQEHLKLRGFASLGLKPIDHPSGKKFVGSAACADCHTKAAAVWEKTTHSHAYETLANLDPARSFDAECLSCHVVGWRPQAFDRFTSGFVSHEATKHLIGVGCENCHGPGSAHVDVELENVKVDAATRTKLRQEMVLKLEHAERACHECHDLDNSPAFDFKTYWPKIEHPGKD
jgi:hypothetical protein